MVDDDVKKIFAKNVFRLRKQKGLTQQELGDQIGLGKTTVSQWESAQKLPHAASIQKISAFFNVAKSVLFAEGNEKYLSYGKMLSLPIVGIISCGNGSFTYEEIENYEATPDSWVRGGEFFYLRAEGDSMINARILNGDLVLIRRQADLENGEIGAIVVNDKIYLKRIYKDGNRISLHSENPNYPRMTVSEDDEVYIIGKLKKIIIST